MPLWQWLLDAALLLLLLPLVFGLALIVRRRLLSRDGGTFELSHRLRMTRPGRGWVIGLGRYRGETLEWFRVFSLSPRPKRVWTRSELTYAGRREPTEGESASLYADHLIAACTTPDGPLELAMSVSSLTGFQSWLESGPPGTDWDHPRRH